VLENQFIYPKPKGSKLSFFAPHGVGVNEENQWGHLQFIKIYLKYIYQKKSPGGWAPGDFRKYLYSVI